MGQTISRTMEPTAGRLYSSNLAARRGRPHPSRSASCGTRVGVLDQTVAFNPFTPRSRPAPTDQSRQGRRTVDALFRRQREGNINGGFPSVFREPFGHRRHVTSIDAPMAPTIGKLQFWFEYCAPARLTGSPMGWVADLRQRNRGPAAGRNTSPRSCGRMSTSLRTTAWTGSSPPRSGHDPMVVNRFPRTKPKLCPEINISKHRPKLALERDADSKTSHRALGADGRIGASSLRHSRVSQPSGVGADSSLIGAFSPARRWSSLTILPPIKIAFIAPPVGVLRYRGCPKSQIFHERGRYELPTIRLENRSLIQPRTVRSIPSIVLQQSPTFYLSVFLIGVSPILNESHGCIRIACVSAIGAP